jgi:import inner membrane translocase subunit TIM22
VPLVPAGLAGAGYFRPETPMTSWVTEQCPYRGVMGVVVGYGLGLVFGLMMAGMAVSQPHLEPFSGAVPPPEPAKVPLWQQLREGLRDMKVRSLSTGRNFALVSGVFSTMDCFLERLTGRHDARTTTASGFVSGALLAAQSRSPQAMLIGGAGFAAFSLGIHFLTPLIFD